MPGKSMSTSTPERASAARGQRTPTQSSPAPAGSSTGERDENYALVSALYHLLQGAETLDQYIGDARRADDEELIEFFEQTKQAFMEHAAEAKALLAARLDMGEEDEDEEEDEEEEE